MSPLTTLLRRANAGDEAARQQLFAVAYDELRALARARLRDGGRNTLLDTTALVHESFLRFVQAGRLCGADRGQFFAYAAAVMRSVIVDFARQRLAVRRGGGAEHVSFDTEQADKWSEERATQPDEQAQQVLHIHQALEALAQDDPRLAQVVEMRYFAGMDDTEIATALGITDRTVRRDWQRARLLLAAVIG